MAGCSASVIQFPTTALWPSCNDGSIAEQSQLCCLNKDVAVLLSVSRRLHYSIIKPATRDSQGGLLRLGCRSVWPSVAK